MAKRSSRWCGSCKEIHSGDCPNKPKWGKETKSSGGFSRVKSGRGGRPWRRKRQRVFERDDYLCQSCLSDGKLTAVELHGPNAGICDHIIPIAEGGSDYEQNLQTLCRRCSDEKTKQESLRGRGV